MHAARWFWRYSGLRASLAAGLMGHAVMSLAQTAAPQELASKSGCFSCHGMVHKQVGPGFAQVAARYRNDGEAQLRLAGKIQHGGVGVWGRVIMPRQAQVSDADAQILSRWVLHQPSPP